MERVHKRILILFVLFLPLSWAASPVGSVYRLVTIVLFTIFLVSNGLQIRVDPSSKRLFSAVISLFAWTAFSMIWGTNFDESIRSILTYTLFFLIAIPMVSLQYGDESLEESINQTLICVGLMSALLFIFGNRAQVGIYGSRSTLRILGTNTDPNEFAGIFCMPLSIAIYLLFQRKSRYKLLMSISVGLELLAVILSGSRGALLGCVIAIGLTIVMNIRESMKRTVMVFLLSIIMCFVFSQYLLKLVPVDVLERMSIQRLLSDGGGGRSAIWKDAIQQFVDGNALRMLFGYGANGLMANGERGATATMHNYYLQILVNYGFVGIILYLRMLYCAVVKFLHYNKNYLPGFLGLAALSFTLTTTPNYKPFWVVIAIALLPGKCLQCKGD